MAKNLGGGKAKEKTEGGGSKGGGINARKGWGRKNTTQGSSQVKNVLLCGPWEGKA